MKKAIAWVVGSEGTPLPLEPGHLDLEQRLEDWVEANIDIVADDVLLIGRQVMTVYGTKLDILGVNGRGDLVVIELKRDQTLRETVAQALEYAAWASMLSDDKVAALGSQTYGDEDQFRAKFAEKFGVPLPEALNTGQRILLVAPQISGVTAGVIEYLAGTYGVPINAVSFDLFTLDGRQVLVRHVVREESEASTSPGPRKRRANRTLAEFITLATDNNVGPIFEYLLELKDILPITERFVTTYAMKGRTPESTTLAAFSLYPTAETNPDVLGINMSPENWSKLYDRSLDECRMVASELQSIGKSMTTWEDWVMVGLSTLEQAKEFDRRFRAFVAGAD